MEQRTVLVDGIETSYITAGDGPVPLLMLHGGGSDFSLFSWKNALKDLAATHHLLALDLPGYGRSGRPADLYADPLRYHIHFIPKFVDVLGFNQIDLMGYSMGAFMGAYLLGHKSK